MAFFYDQVQMSVSGTPGTGTITLGSATTGYQSFSAAGVASGTVVSYNLTDTGNAWEVGFGTYTSSGTTLTRNVTFSSNSNAAISATSACIVTIVMRAEDLIQSVTLTGNTAGATTIQLSPTLDFAAASGITASGTSNTISLYGAQIFATQGIGLTTLQNSITLGLQNPLEFYEPVSLNAGSVAVSLPVGSTMMFAPLEMPDVGLFNKFEFLGNFTLSFASHATSSTSATTTGHVGQSLTFAIYSALGGTSSNQFTFFYSTSVSYGLTQSMSVSSHSMTNSWTFNWQQGTTTSSTLVTSSSSSTLSNFANSTLMSLWRAIDIPFVSTLTLQGNYVVGIQGSTSTAGTSGLSWSASFAGISAISSAIWEINQSVVPYVFMPGVGSLSTTTNVVSSFDQNSLSSQASYWRPYFYMINQSY